MNSRLTRSITKSYNLSPFTPTTESYTAQCVVCRRSDVARMALLAATHHLPPSTMVTSHRWRVRGLSRAVGVWVSTACRPVRDLFRNHFPRCRVGLRRFCSFLSFLMQARVSVQQRLMGFFSVLRVSGWTVKFPRPMHSDEGSHSGSDPSVCTTVGRCDACTIDGQHCRSGVSVSGNLRCTALVANIFSNSVL